MEFENDESSAALLFKLPRVTDANSPNKAKHLFFGGKGD